MVDFVTEQAFWKAYKSFERVTSVHDTKSYEDWRRLQSAVVDVAGRYGTWTGHWEGGDFYHAGDWFTSLTDGFALRTAAPLKKIEFGCFQKVVSEHSPFAWLNIMGEVNSPTDGLEMLIHPKAIVAWWDGKTREECRRELKSLGYREEA